MRKAVLILLGSLVLSAAAMPASASPTVIKPNVPTVSNVIEVSSGCGQWFYRDAYGYCRPYYGGYAPVYSYPAWYEYPHRHWHNWRYWHHGH